MRRYGEGMSTTPMMLEAVNPIANHMQKTEVGRETVSTDGGQ